MFVNKIPFLVTKSQHIHFGTIKSLANRQTPTVAAALKSVLHIYHRRGFHVITVNADPEFQPLEAEVGSVQFNFRARDEHVPDIKRYIRTIKDRVRSCYNILPYSYIPRVMINRLVGNAV
jgi:hypothetical protein